MRIIAPVSFPSRWTPASERGLLGSAHGPRGGWLHGAQLSPEQVAAAVVVSV
ncbi:MAG: hypothetical protein JST92_27355, partial [Deltaproteobacteria bacterium]|nr:hypothetical protein [Deltaproteobacteria bacterium]